MTTSATSSLTNRELPSYLSVDSDGPWATYLE